MPKAIVGTRLLTTRQVAKQLSVTPRTVALWLREGELPGIKINGYTWRVRESDLEEFIESRRVQA